METRTSHGRNREEDEVLERQIVSTTHNVEDVIEFHLVHRLLADARQKKHIIGRLKSLVINFVWPTRDLENEIQDMNSLKEMVMQQFQGTINFKEDSFSPAPAPSSKPLATSNNNFVVGFDEKVIQIMERLTGHQSGLQIVTIVGMGGIDTKLNKSIGADDFETDLEGEDHELGLKLYQTLCGRRYLIVLDDMWSIEAWYRIKNLFPNNDERSRVVITTRISSAATPLSSSSFEMDFLNEDQSWKLFCGNVFLEKGCPLELEHIGKDIVRACKGLPLSIVVIGGLLRHSRGTSDYWENIARDLNSVLISGNDGHCLNILSLSYNHLPAHLKPCFLYMGIFREDEEIRVSRLINLLVAEGFLKPKEGLTMEEVAANYINDLVDRNLILVDSRKWDGRIKFCKMHDLVREVCLKIGEREKIFQRMSWDEFSAETNVVRRIVFRGNRIPSKCPPASLARTFLSESSKLKGALTFKFRLLRVLSLDRRHSSGVFFKHVNLRYLVCSLEIENLKLPSSISLLWNLHTLIFTTYEQVKVPSKIWYMRQLRHLQSYKLSLPKPPPCEEDELALLLNIHTLSKVVNMSFTEQVCNRIPNIKKLGIRYEGQKKCYFYLNHLHKLQSLFCYFEVPKRDEFLGSLRLPNSLRKLYLRNCGLHWEDVNRFGLLLPHLQVLKLDGHKAVVGKEWDCVEGAFPCLKVLEITCKDLIKWSAESSGCFPVLQKVELFNLEKLERIPSEIQTLGSLRLFGCSLSAAISSVEILDEQLSFGNDDFHLQITFYDPEKSKRLMEEVDINSFTPNNFKLI